MNQLKKIQIYRTRNVECWSTGENGLNLHDGDINHKAILKCIPGPPRNFACCNIPAKTVRHCLGLKHVAKTIFCQGSFFTAGRQDCARVSASSSPCTKAVSHVPQRCVHNKAGENGT